jgi:hypothetical protein
VENSGGETEAAKFEAASTRQLEVKKEAKFVPAVS